MIIKFLFNQVNSLASDSYVLWWLVYRQSDLLLVEVNNAYFKTKLTRR